MPIDVNSLSDKEFQELRTDVQRRYIRDHDLKASEEQRKKMRGLDRAEPIIDAADVGIDRSNTYSTFDWDYGDIEIELEAADETHGNLVLRIRDGDDSGYVYRRGDMAELAGMMVQLVKLLREIF